MNRSVAVKVDVDTFEGMRKGVPNLLSLFTGCKVTASFFVPTGRDHTGRTVKRVFTRKGFLKKAGRVGVVSTYGIKTLMYGLLLPGPRIAAGNAPLMRRIRAEGHEVGIHGYDHVYWHDHIKDMDEERTRKEVERSFGAYRMLMGEESLSFAAPGWMINPYVLSLFAKRGLIYSSDTRGFAPFYPVMRGRRFGILQIPTTLPTLDEVIGIAGTNDEALNEYYQGLLTPGLNILTVHTELEGRNWTGFLERFIRRSLDRGYTFHRLIDIAVRYRGSKKTPSCGVGYGYVDGRAGEVCLQREGPGA